MALCKHNVIYIRQVRVKHVEDKELHISPYTYPILMCYHHTSPSSSDSVKGYVCPGIQENSTKNGVLPKPWFTPLLCVSASSWFWHPCWRTFLRGTSCWAQCCQVCGEKFPHLASSPSTRLLALGKSATARSRAPGRSRSKHHVTPSSQDMSIILTKWTTVSHFSLGIQ